MALTVLLVRLLIPAAMCVFAVSFYASIQPMARSEKLFPVLMIVATLLVAAVIIAGEIRRFVTAARRADGAVDLAKVDAEGLRHVGWKRALAVAGACLLYVLVVDRLGLMLTGALVYILCASALIADRASRRQWIAAAIGAVAAGIVFDAVFRVWLGLPLPGL